MKKRLLIALLAATLFVSVPAFASTDGIEYDYFKDDNYIVNGSFDDLSNVQQDTDADKWSYTLNKGVDLETEKVYAGDSAAKVTFTAPYAGFVYRYHPHKMEANTEYTHTVHVAGDKDSAGQSVRMFLQITYQDSGWKLLYMPVQTITLSEDWAEYSYGFQYSYEFEEGAETGTFIVKTTAGEDIRTEHFPLASDALGGMDLIMDVPSADISADAPFVMYLDAVSMFKTYDAKITVRDRQNAEVKTLTSENFSIKDYAGNVLSTEVIYDATESAYVISGLKEPAVVSVTLGEETLPEVRLNASKNEAVIVPSYEVKITVKDEADLPVTDAIVTLKQNGKVVGNCENHGDGTYTFANASGDYTVSVVKTGYQAESNVPITILETQKTIVLTKNSASTTPDGGKEEPPEQNGGCGGCSGKTSSLAGLVMLSACALIAGVGKRFI